MQREYIQQRTGGFYVTGTRVSLDSTESIRQNFSPLTLEHGSIIQLDQQAMDAKAIKDFNEALKLAKRTEAEKDLSRSRPHKDKE